MHLVGIELGKTDEVDHCRMANSKTGTTAKFVLVGFVVNKMNVGKTILGSSCIGKGFDLLVCGKNEEVAGEDGMAPGYPLAIGCAKTYGLARNVGEDVLTSECLLRLQVFAESGMHIEPLVGTVWSIGWGKDIGYGEEVIWEWDTIYWHPQTGLWIDRLGGRAECKLGSIYRVGNLCGGTFKGQCIHTSSFMYFSLSNSVLCITIICTGMKKTDAMHC